LVAKGMGRSTSKQHSAPGLTQTSRISQAPTLQHFKALANPRGLSHAFKADAFNLTGFPSHGTGNSPLT
jgi:hypothetical protein